MVLPVSSLVVLGLLLVLAAVSDIRARRVSNSLNAAVLAAGLLTQFVTFGPRAGGMAALAGATVLAILWIPWMRGYFGGGDVKLASAVAVWIGFDPLAFYLLGSGLAGGALALVCYARSSSRARADVRANLLQAAYAGSLGPVSVNEPGRVSVPYAAAIAAGAVAALGWGG